MNRKTILIIVGVLAVLCICAAVGAVLIFNRAGQVISNAASSDPVKVSGVAQKITDYQLPEGYQESVSMSLLGISMAGFSTPDQHTGIFLFQMPPNNQMNVDQFRDQIQQMAEKQTGENYNLEQTGTQTVSIRGQTVELLIFEGTSSSGMTIRQELGTFQGKGGPAWVMIIGPVDTWDQAVVDAFIGSMK